MYYFTGSSRIHVFLEKFLELLFPMGTYCICCGKYIDLTRTYCLCDQCMAAINWGRIYIDLEEERREAGRTKYLDSALACMVYGLHSRRLVFDLKYNKKTFMARPISMIMADRLMTDESLREIIDSIDYVVPVPLHPKKKKQRGFNQTELIGSDLTARLNSAKAYTNVSQPNTETFEKHSAGLRSTRAVNNAVKPSNEKSGKHTPGLDSAIPEKHLAPRRDAASSDASVPSGKICFIPDCLLRVRETQAQRSITGKERFSNLEGAFAFNDKYDDQLQGASVLLVDDIFTTGATADCCARLLKGHGARDVHFIALATGNDYLRGASRDRKDEEFLKYM